MAERLAYDIARDLREPGPWPSLKLMTEAADKLEDLIDLLAAAQTARDRHQAERDAARQALWDIYAVLGFDIDGVPTPPPDSAMPRSLADLVTAAAHEYRERCEAENDAATTAR